MVELEFTKSQFNVHDFCSFISNTAETIMRERQRGVPIEITMQLLHASVPKIDTNEVVRSNFEEMATVAYEIPRYDSEENQARAIKDFRDINYLKCREALKSKGFT